MYFVTRLGVTVEDLTSYFDVSKGMDLTFYFDLMNGMGSSCEAEEERERDIH